jgi:hypothetical protein
MSNSTNSFTFTKRSVRIFAVFILFACGPGMADYDEFMSFFMPESTNATAQNQKYHYTSQFFYNDIESEYALMAVKEESPILTLSDIENIEAWTKYCQGKVSKQDIREGVLSSIVGSKLESYFKSYKNQLAIDYLIFVQEAEQNDSALANLEVDAPKPTNPATDIKILTQLLGRAKHDFLKERIAFQLVKTYSIAKKHEESVSSFYKYIPLIEDKSFISDWALMRKAESEIALGDSAEAYYDFSRVFEKSESHKNQADLIVRSRINGFPEGALKYCKDNHEKASLYAFTAIKPNIDGLPMLEKMVELDPKNQMIELIMAREINKNEKFYYNQLYSEYDDEETKKTVKLEQEKATDYWSKLKDFSIKCADNQALPKTGFWQTASSYMEYVQGNFAKSEEFLNQAKAIKTDNLGLKNQILLQELLLISKQNTSITPEVEANFLPILESFAKPKDYRISNAILESCKILSAKYSGVSEIEKTENKGGWLSSCSKKKEEAPIIINTPHAIAKAYLLTMLTTYQNNSSQEYGGFESQKDMFLIEDTTSLATIEKVIAYFSETNKTDFDKRLQKLVGFDNDHLYTLMGRRAMDEANYAKAAEAFSKVSPSVWKKDEWKYFDEDPLYISTKYGEDKKNPNYTPYTFAKKMAELEAKLKANPNDAESAYLLGCGTYNTTHEGNSWILRKHSWSGAEINSYSKNKFDSDYFQASKAKAFFILASKSSNSELAAKACFGAALCERNEYEVFVSLQESNPEETQEAYQSRMGKIRANKYSEYFKILNSKYQNTQYQKQVLQECGDYTLFNGGK